MTMTNRFVLLFSLLAVLTACSEEPAPVETPSLPLATPALPKTITACTSFDSNMANNTHPLHNQIYRVKDNAFVSCEELVRALAATDVVLLGEKHGEMEQHKRQAVVVNGLLELGVSIVKRSISMGID